jgi:hypothetical protein
MLRWLQRLFGRKVAPSSDQPEQGTGVDSAMSRSRPTGGDSGTDGTTTGPGDNETFVGRAEGQDTGYTGETGAEARSERDRQDGDR